MPLLKNKLDCDKLLGKTFVSGKRGQDFEDAASDRFFDAAGHTRAITDFFVHVRVRHNLTSQVFILANQLNHERLFPSIVYNKRPSLQNMKTSCFSFDGDMYHSLRLAKLVVDKKRMVSNSRGNDGDRISSTAGQAFETKALDHVIRHFGIDESIINKTEDG